MLDNCLKLMKAHLFIQYAVRPHMNWSFEFMCLRTLYTLDWLIGKTLQWIFGVTPCLRFLHPATTQKIDIFDSWAVIWYLERQHTTSSFWVTSVSTVHMVDNVLARKNLLKWCVTQCTCTCVVGITPVVMPENCLEGGKDSLLYIAILIGVFYLLFVHEWQVPDIVISAHRDSIQYGDPVGYGSDRERLTQRNSDSPPLAALCIRWKDSYYHVRWPENIRSLEA